MKLIDNWRTSWKFYSTLAAITAGAFNAALAANFYGLLDALSPQQIAGINAIFVGVVIPTLRAVKQFADEQEAPLATKPPTEGQP